jgi:hypothetical protein
MQPSGPAQHFKVAYAKRNIPFRIDDVTAVQKSETRSSRFPPKMALQSMLDPESESREKNRL